MKMQVPLGISIVRGQASLLQREQREQAPQIPQIYTLRMTVARETRKMQRFRHLSTTSPTRAVDKPFQSDWAC
ncbi:hypothetical protein [Pseudomonas sp. NPDC089569]|uniref:hypothetical protein n=1 Tax=Pseudomonas sp. NPDC089569 TaxID=3390722 RepID=UPI003CFE4457